MEHAKEEDEALEKLEEEKEEERHEEELKSAEDAAEMDEVNEEEPAAEGEIVHEVKKEEPTGDVGGVKDAPEPALSSFQVPRESAESTPTAAKSSAGSDAARTRGRGSRQPGRHAPLGDDHQKEDVNAEQ